MTKKLISAMLLLPGISFAQQTNVLFIGNSYTNVNDLPNIFKQVALSLGDTVNVASSTPGGYTFEAHSSYAPTLAAINQQAWDYVVLQEQSQRPSFSPEQVAQECYPFAAQLVDSILANDSCTQPMFYMTWGRQNGDASNCASWPPVCTYDGMQQRLRESYLEMAFDNSAFAAPVGVAWKHVRDTHPLINLYNADESHPSPEGSYLAASVFYCTVFRTSCESASFNFSLDPDTAAILREIASSTVLDSLATWNIGVNDPDAGFTMETFDSCELMFHPSSPGTHFWDFGDGSTSEESDPFHLFSNDPVVTVTHNVTDDCGRSASWSQEINACAVGIERHAPLLFFDLRWTSDGILTVWNPDYLEGTLVIVDMMGRHVFTSAAPDGRELHVSLHCPLFWRFTTADRLTDTGRIIIP